MPSRTILCEDGAEESADLAAAGAINIACTPISTRPGFCTLSWEYPAGAKPAEAPPAAKPRAATKPKSKSKKKPVPKSKPNKKTPRSIRRRKSS